MSNVKCPILNLKERGAGPSKTGEGCLFSIDYTAELTPTFQVKLHPLIRK
jgi:hypothetical protein